MTALPIPSVASLASAAQIAADAYLAQLPRTAAIVKRHVDAPVNSPDAGRMKRAKAQAYGRLRALRERRDAAAQALFDAILRGDA